MKKKNNKFLTILMVTLFIGGVSFYISNNTNEGSLIQVAHGNSLESSAGLASSNPVTTTTSNTSDKISSDISFLTTLASLKKIKIDTALFTNKYFTILKNNSVKIDSIIPGRSNPFSPIDTNKKISNNVISKIVTEDPTQITDKTAVFNGIINDKGDITDAYFEYGTTLNLGNTTPIVKTSLVGTFIKNVVGLSSKTNYFFRACSKINNITTCGEIISFTTK